MAPMCESRADLEALLGWKVADRAFAAEARRSVGSVDGWPLETLTFRAADGEAIEASYLRPPDGAGAAPAALYLHAHGNRYAVGRAELSDGRPSLRGPYLHEFRRLGVAALCLDAPCFGARATPGEQARAKAEMWRGRTLFGQMLAEFSGAVGFLAAEPTIDPNRIAAVGFSMGATHAFWLAALDRRIAAAAALCAFADMERLVDDGGHDAHGVYMTVPGLLPRWRTGDVAALAAPRPLFVAIGSDDPLTPPAAFAAGRRDLEAGYAAAGAADALTFHIAGRSGHLETPAMRAACLSFLSDALRVEAEAMIE